MFDITNNHICDLDKKYIDMLNDDFLLTKISNCGNIFEIYSANNYYYLIYDTITNKCISSSKCQLYYFSKDCKYIFFQKYTIDLQLIENNYHKDLLFLYDIEKHEKLNLDNHYKIFILDICNDSMLYKDEFGLKQYNFKQNLTYDINEDSSIIDAMYNDNNIILLYNDRIITINDSSEKMVIKHMIKNSIDKYDFNYLVHYEKDKYIILSTFNNDIIIIYDFQNNTIYFFPKKDKCKQFYYKSRST